MTLTSPSQNALSDLRDQTTVDIDSMDEDVAIALGPFEDCTSNQAIAFGELLKPRHRGLIAASIERAEIEVAEVEGVSLEQLAVEIAMVKLQLLMLPHVTGCVHVQTNPYYADDVEKTVANAKRIIHIFAILSPDLPTSRICIKIPATWAGIQACRILESLPSPIKTLATTLFSLEQAQLAAEAGCTYIAPYVNELKVHFDPNYVDENKLFDLVLDVQRYYELHGYRTQVLVASLTNVEEIMSLAGVHHITISPGLLSQLRQMELIDDTLSIFGQPHTTKHLYAEKVTWMDREEEYQKAVAASAGGSVARKLGEAVQIFKGMQDKLEALMKPGVEIAEGNRV